jgi:hypothetical protein
MNQNSLETKNRLKNERGVKKNAKNTLRTHELIQTPNTGGHKVVRATIPSKIHGSYTNWWISGPLTQAPRGGETLKEKNKNGGGEGPHPI